VILLDTSGLLAALLDEVVRGDDGRQLIRIDAANTGKRMSAVWWMTP